MSDVWTPIREALESKAPCALCQLVETRGSTPQKAGAVMVVLENGQQLGTLGGGCVEAEVKRLAIRRIGSAQATLETFQLDHDYGWDDGLICGGRMTVLIDPLTATSRKDCYRALVEQLVLHKPVWQLVSIEASKSQVVESSLAIVDESANLLSKTDRCDANDVTNHEPETHSDKLTTNDIGWQQEQLLEATTANRPRAQHGVAVIPFRARSPLLIVGAGHVGQAVSSLAANVGFDVHICDDRSDMASKVRFPDAVNHTIGSFDQTLTSVDVTAETYCLIVTRGHNHDQLALRHLIDRGAKYVGMIGSRRKIKLIFENLIDDGVSPDRIDGVFAPVGIDIGSQTVEEIAISIVAELIAHRNRDGIVPGRPSAIHVQ